MKSRGEPKTKTKENSAREMLKLQNFRLRFWLQGLGGRAPPTVEWSDTISAEIFTGKDLQVLEPR